MKKDKSFYIFISIMTFILGIFLSIGCMIGLKNYIFIGQSGSSSNGTCYTSCENKVTIDDKGISEAVNKLYDATVFVENYKKNTLQGTGTGFVYKVDDNYGYILTNYHVINGNDSIKVVMSDDSVADAVYLGGDQYADVAVLRISKTFVTKVAEIGSSETTALGDTVFTIGTPVDYEYRGTVTRGILSGKDRLITVNNIDTYITKVLQTDAAINPGNSGGPLANSKGQVIGINSLKLVESEIEGMGFAIAIEDVMIHIDKFENGKEIIRPFLGVSMLDVTATMALYQNGIMIEPNIKNGAVIVSTVEGSSVDGILQKGDVITKISGNEIKNGAYLKYELYKHEVGEKIEITYIRENIEKTVTVTLKENKDN